MVYPKYLTYKDRTYSVMDDIQLTNEFKDNKGYVDRKTNKIYICAKNNPPKNLDVPILKVDPESGEKTMIPAPEEEVNNYFITKNLAAVTFANIVDGTNPDDVLYDEEALVDMNAATSLFTPIMDTEKDDPLKQIIKKTILDKKIDINRLKHRLPQKYGLTNLKSALIGKTKMSITNFNIWCELLGIDYEICITDNGSDTENPLEKDIVYTSSNNHIE